MAKSRLTEDEIRFIFSLNTSQAQQEYHKLERANKELTEANPRAAQRNAPAPFFTLMDSIINEDKGNKKKEVCQNAHLFFYAQSP